MHSKIIKKIKNLSLNVLENVDLAPFTTINIGGPARLLVKVQNSSDLLLLLKICSSDKYPYIILGKGSNLLIADSGFKGLVIINETNKWEILEDKISNHDIPNVIPRLDKESLGQFKKPHGEKNVLVKCDSGIKIPYLIKALQKEGIVGLEWFSGIPATIGGAVYMNMHGGNDYFGNLVYKAKIFDGKNERIVDNKYFKFDYDYSVLHDSKEIIVWTILCLRRGNAEEARELSRNWAIAKSNQPQKSAGCIFRNLSNEEMKLSGLNSNSIGYVIDKILNLKGLEKGGAKISDNHAAFIENIGGASSEDVIYLINKIKSEAKRKIGLELETEIEFIGEF